MMESAAFLPSGPAESPRIRAFAERSLTSMPPVNLRDKAKYLQWMERLTDHMLGKDEERERKQREAAKAKSMTQTPPSSSSGAIGSASSDAADMAMDMNRITADMKIASLSSLGKIRKLRSSVEAFTLRPTNAQTSVEADDQVRSGGKSVDWADQHPPPVRSAKDFKTSVTSSINEAVRIGAENIPENDEMIASTDISAAELKAVEAVEPASNMTSTGERGLQKSDSFGAPRINRGHPDDKSTIEVPDKMTLPGDLESKKGGQSQVDGAALEGEDGRAGGAQEAAIVDAAITLYEPKFNDKGELDFSGSWRAPKEGTNAETVNQTTKKSADQLTSSVSISASSNVKKSLDLSGLSLDELKDLQGHY